MQEGKGFDSGKEYTFSAYKTMADQYKQKW
jgi:hypothetical protein